jgi:hypothetical protein
MAQTLQLAGYDDPCKTYFHHLLKSYKKDDNPAPKPKLALPIPVIKRTLSWYKQHHSPQHQAISDLVCMAFFFLLRVGKYMMPSRSTVT